MSKLSPDEEFREDWKKFVRDFLPNRFKRYDINPSDDNRGYAALLVEALQKGDPGIFFDELYNNSIDYCSEQEYQAYQECKKEFSKEWEDPVMVANDMENYPYFRDDFNEIYEQREQDNWKDLVGGIDILVWNPKTSVHAGWVGDPQDADDEIDENPSLKDWYQKALVYISAQQIRTIIDNGFDYDVELFIGGICDAADLLETLTENIPNIYHASSVVVGAYDGLNGAGYFEHGSTNARLMLVIGDKKNPLNVDFGNYSLGDVFGTKEWTWR
jgi:hypothetical protein